MTRISWLALAFPLLAIVLWLVPESAAFALERRVKHHLRSQKTRDKNRRRGEWFDVEPADVLSLVEKLRAGDESVLADR